MVAPLDLPEGNLTACFSAEYSAAHNNTPHQVLTAHRVGSTELTVGAICPASSGMYLVPPFCVPCEACPEDEERVSCGWEGHETSAGFCSTVPGQMAYVAADEASYETAEDLTLSIVLVVADGPQAADPTNGYRVSAMVGSSTEWEVLVENTGSTDKVFVVGGLLQGVQYTLSVSALNNVGAGIPGASTPSFLTPNSPSSPTEVALSLSNTGILTLRWRAPGDGGYSITGYRIFEQQGDELDDAAWAVLVANTTHTATIQGDLLSWEFSNLTPGTVHWYMVKAINKAGEGLGSDPKMVRMHSLPGTPGTPLVASVSSSSASFTWSAPDNGGSPITSYRCQVLHSGFDTVTEFTTGEGAPQTTLTGLEMATVYSVRVSAITAIGEGNSSLWSP